MKSIFDFSDYRRYIEAKIEAQAISRGYRSRLSEVAGCQPAYFSQVLAGKSNMTSDQASNLSDYWEFNEHEADYFLALVDFERAASPSLKRRLKGKLKRLRDEFYQDFATYRQPSVEERSAAELYYSTWLFSAIHVLLSVVQFQTASALSAQLGVAEAEIQTLLKSMLEQGLTQEQSGSWRPVHKHLHATTSSMFSSLHHRNWRLRAIDTLAPKKPANLHYTGVYSLSESDFLKLKESLLETIDATRALVEPSREEAGACLLIDWFKV
jgi:uncharacterized protein (TIGR02147 family)